MSTNLIWRKVITTPQGNTLSDTLKHTISHKYWDQDGSLSAMPIILNSSDINYFEGLRDAGIKDAGKVIDLITKFDEIQLSIE